MNLRSKTKGELIRIIEEERSKHFFVKAKYLFSFAMHRLIESSKEMNIICVTIWADTTDEALDILRKKFKHHSISAMNKTQFRKHEDEKTG